ncbi:MAG: hypothetical protein P4M01_11725 [Acidobacteriota bacterium]|nr:hypothetical protein [Acidobacteriota bacterium]
MEENSSSPTTVSASASQFPGPGRAGMWAWVAQRISALLAVILIVAHLLFTWQPLLQFLLLLVVTFHAALGVRVILLDFRIVDLASHRWVTWILLVLAVAVILAAWLSIYRCFPYPSLAGMVPHIGGEAS